MVWRCPSDPLKFALKDDSANRAILAHVFQAADPDGASTHIDSKLTGKYVRRIW